MERLLVLLLLAAGARSQEQPVEALSSYINVAVRAAVEPTVTRLLGRLEEVTARLDTLDTRLDTVDARVDTLDSRLDAFDSRIDGLVTQFIAIDSRLDGLTAQVSDQDSRIDGIDGQVIYDSSRIDDHGSQLADLASRLDGHESRLDELTSDVSRLNSTAESRPHVSPASIRHCSELPAGAESGVHQLKSIEDSTEPLPAYCDMQTDGGGWTVIQRRADFEPRQSFLRGWEDYRNGFGNLTREFWWGLEKVHRLTSRPGSKFQLRIDMEDSGETKYAVYQNFTLTPESDGYRLRAGDYSGDAGDSLTYHVGQRFSTKDRDQDASKDRHCAEKYKGAWWYNSCHRANLNAQYLAGPAPGEDGINWKTFKGYKYSLEKVEMKIRPV